MDFFKFFLRLKRKNPKIFAMIGTLNEFLVSIVFDLNRKKLFFHPKNLELNKKIFELRQLNVSDSVLLKKFFEKIPNNEIVFFQPHSFDLKTIKFLLKRKSFFAMVAFSRKQIVGYGLIKFFFPKRAMIGIFVEKDFRNAGLGKILTIELSTVAENSEFVPQATISKQNASSIKMFESAGFVPINDLGNELLFEKKLVKILRIEK